MSHEKFQYLYEAAECLKVLAHPVRLQMVTLLLQRDRPVFELAELTGIKSHIASEHLRLMLRCGFLAAERNGRSIIYSVAEPHLKELLQCIESRFKSKKRNTRRYSYVSS